MAAQGAVSTEKLTASCVSGIPLMRLRISALDILRSSSSLPIPALQLREDNAVAGTVPDSSTLDNARLLLECFLNAAPLVEALSVLSIQLVSSAPPHNS